jgi:NAD(P)-dependent dehydrogenase (short-subunit alcohol dehydrogenase family)
MAKPLRRTCTDVKRRIPTTESTTAGHQLAHHPKAFTACLFIPQNHERRFWLFPPHKWGAPTTNLDTNRGALITLTRTMALELAGSGVRVNCVCPASVATPLLRASFLRSPVQRQRERNRKRHPLGRFRTPEDVASLFLFLASDEASWVTGGDWGASIARRWQN